MKNINTSTSSLFSERRGLCKGKRRGGGEWVKGYIVGDDILIPFENDYIIDEWHIHGWNAFEVVPESVCPFAFLLDSSGEEIYENDIVECYSEDGLIYTFVVKQGVFGGVPNDESYGYPAFAFVPYDEETKRCGKYGLRNDPVYWLNNYTIKIAGNVCDE